MEIKFQLTKATIYHTIMSMAYFMPSQDIRKTCRGNVYPIKPHFYTEKLAFAGVYLIMPPNFEEVEGAYWFGSVHAVQ